MSKTQWDAKCQACNVWVTVTFRDGVPLRSEDVHTMFPLNGDEPTILHHGCPNGDEISPILRMALT